MKLRSFFLRTTWYTAQWFPGYVPGVCLSLSSVIFVCLSPTAFPLRRHPSCRSVTSFPVDAVGSRDTVACGGLIIFPSDCIISRRVLSTAEQRMIRDYSIASTSCLHLHASYWSFSCVLGVQLFCLNKHWCNISGSAITVANCVPRICTFRNDVK